MPVPARATRGISCLNSARGTMWIAGFVSIRVNCILDNQGAIGENDESFLNEEKDKDAEGLEK